MKNENEEVKNKPKLNNLIVLFSVITLGVAIWFGSSMINNKSCNSKAVKVMKNIKLSNHLEKDSIKNK